MKTRWPIRARPSVGLAPGAEVPLSPEVASIRYRWRHKAAEEREAQGIPDRVEGQPMGDAVAKVFLTTQSALRPEIVVFALLGLFGDLLFCLAFFLGHLGRLLFCLELLFDFPGGLLFCLELLHTLGYAGLCLFFRACLGCCVLKRCYDLIEERIWIS